MNEQPSSLSLTRGESPPPLHTHTHRPQKQDSFPSYKNARGSFFFRFLTLFPAVPVCVCVCVFMCRAGK